MMLRPISLHSHDFYLGLEGDCRCFEASSTMVKEGNDKRQTKDEGKDSCFFSHFSVCLALSLCLSPSLCPYISIHSIHLSVCILSLQQAYPVLLTLVNHSPTKSHWRRRTRWPDSSRWILCAGVKGQDVR